MITESYKQGQL